MSDYAPFVIIGLATGSLFGLAGMGLVLTYKTSGIFNFAHGAVAALAAYAYYDLNVLRGVPTALALVLAVAVLPALLAVALERVARVLSRGATTPRIVAMVGLQIGITGLLWAWYGTAALPFPSVLPTGTFTAGGVVVGQDQLISLLLGSAGAAVLYAFFRWSTLGVRMRAVVDDPDLLSLSGTSPLLVRTAAWLVGCWFAAVSGVLLAPTIGLDALLLTLLVVQAFGAAAVGLFQSLPMTYLGGLVIGVAAALVTMNPRGWTALEGLSTSVPFLVLFLVLLVAGRSRLSDPSEAKTSSVQGPALVGPAASRILAAMAVSLAACLPFVVGARLPVFLNGLAMIVVFYSLSLLVRMSGQVSLAHASFVAVGAATFAHLGSGGLPWLLAVLVAGLVALPVGFLVAIPAIRLSGLYLALATLGFGLLLEKAVYNKTWMFGPLGNLTAPRPPLEMLQDDRGYYYVLLAFAVAVGVLVSTVQRSRLGRLLRAMADSPVTLTTLGLSVNQTRIMVFGLSAFLAGVGGALVSGASGSVGGAPYTAFVSMTWLAVLMMCGRGLHTAPVSAAAVIAVAPAYVTDETLVAYFPVLFGIGALLAAMLEASRTGARFTTPHETGAGDRARERVGAQGPIAARLADAAAAHQTSSPPAVALRIGSRSQEVAS